MANDNNTTGFTGCPDHLEVWRRNAARQASDDRFTVLFTELVQAFVACAQPGATPEADGFYRGLQRAYALITGDTEKVVRRQVKSAAFREIFSAVPVARDGEAPVPS